MQKVIKSYEIVGDIALVEIPHGYGREEVASAIMREHKRVRVVAEKKGRMGEFRGEAVEFIIGRRSTTVHRECGCKMLLDIATCYFSEKEKGERMRIAQKVESGERILVPFAGVGAFPLIIARKKECFTKAVELNPRAFGFLCRNIRLNGFCERIRPLFMDAYAARFEERFDRIIIPQPYGHHSFSHFASLCEKGGFVHYYPWLGKDDDAPVFPGFAVTGTGKVSSYAPNVWKWCFDLEKI